ncbi:MAG: aminotransferase class I/II-fold pyridoxal phosphate-dependent enzyme [Raoultibacter sp.]
MYGIRENLLTLERNDYHEHLSNFDYALDCSMGSNPYGTPRLTVPEDVLGSVNLYPDETDTGLKAALRERFAPVADLSDNMIAFSCGSIGAVMALNRLCLVPDKTIICMAPTFTAIVDDFITYQPSFETVGLRAENNYAFCAQDLIDTIAAHPKAYIYIDNPNNPTGQVFSLDHMRQAVEAARAVGSFIVIDEAYGDYMDDANSAACLVEEFENLACVRTFSKALGEAGVRLGYVIAAPIVINALGKVNIPYAKNSLADSFAQQALRSHWRESTRMRVLRDKPRVLAALDHLSVATTDVGVPISMLYTSDHSVDLGAVFQQVGLRVVSCEGYDGLGSFAVRVNLHDDIEQLISLIKQADALL